MDYIEFDSKGIVEIRCMHCKEVVSNRTYIELPDREDPKKKVAVLAMNRRSNYSSITCDLSDGTYCSPVVCSSCKLKAGIDLNEITNQMKIGWKKHMEFAKIPVEKIKEHSKRVKNLKIEEII